MDMEQNKQLQKMLSDVAAGEARAFSNLYDATSAQLYALALKMMHSKAAADDVLQDAFVQVWHRAGDYQIERGKVITWLSSIVRYRAIDALRKRRYDMPLDDGQMASSGNDPVLQQPHDSDASESGDDLGPLRSAMATDDSRFLIECLSRLSDSQKQSITLAFFHGLSHAELSASLSVPLGTIKGRIRRSLQRLKKCLAEIGFTNEISSGTS